MKRIEIWSLIFAMLPLAGCEEAPTPVKAPQTSQSAGGPSAPLPAAPLPAKPVVKVDTSDAATSDPAAGDAAEDREKAQTGVGQKGSGYGGGVITEPVRQYFRAQEAITFSIQIPEGMKLFQAEHNRYPKDWKEFEREILKPADIVLPDLPPGDKYVYDAKEHELMVEHPRRGPDSQ
jgi:hypothetical protein